MRLESLDHVYPKNKITILENNNLLETISFPLEGVIPGLHKQTWNY